MTESSIQRIPSVQGMRAACKDVTSQLDRALARLRETTAEAVDQSLKTARSGRSSSHSLKAAKPVDPRAEPEDLTGKFQTK